MRSGLRTAPAWRALAVTAAFVTVLAVQATPASSAALTFAPASLYTAHSYAAGVAISDLNGDGKPDIATANASSNNDASVLLGTGSGTFGSSTNYAVGGGGPGVAVGDLNGDGKPDLVTANNLSPNVSVLLGDGSGSFGTATTFGAGGANPYPISVAIGDLNGDGKPDLAVANNCSGPGSVSVLLGDGTGSFAFDAAYDAADPTTSPNNCATSVAIGDLNGDGKPDLAVTDDDLSDAAPADQGGVSVLLGKGNGSFGPVTHYHTDSYSWSVAIGDLNGDGKPDLAVANYASPPSGDVSILLGDGSGSFGTATNYGAGAYPQSVAIGDLDGDGKPDLAVADSGSRDVSVLVGTGNGSFGSATQYLVDDGSHPFSGFSPWGVAIGDLNGDGRLDLAVGDDNQDGFVTVLLNTTTAIQNTVAPSISGTAQDGKLLTASHGTWSSPDALTYAYQWQRCDGSGGNCLSIGAATRASYRATSADVGSTLTVVVTATDQESESGQATAAPTGVVASPPPPSNTLAPSISGTAQDGKLLTASHGSWSSPDPLTYTYQWQRCDSSGGNCLGIGAATKASYRATSADVGSRLTVVVTATDKETQSGQATAAPTGVVASPPPPSNTLAPSISGTAQDGKLLTASRGTWSSPDPLTYTYQWLRCDGSGGNCQNIAAATTATHRATSADVGSRLTVVVTATDKETQSGQATAAPTGVVANPPPPSNTVAPSITGTPQAGILLTASHGTWSSPDPLTYTYQWQRCDSSGGNCHNIAATTAGYRATSADVGSRLTVVVTATDKETQSGQATATPVGPVS